MDSTILFDNGHCSMTFLFCQIGNDLASGSVWSRDRQRVGSLVQHSADQSLRQIILLPPPLTLRILSVPMYDDDDEYGGGTVWGMQDISSGSLFEETYQCLSASTLPAGPIRDTVEYGNKILMPASALDTLSRLNIMYPMMFRISDERGKKSTHCGVLEFSAPEGVVYLPPWILKTLETRSGDLVNLSNVALSLGNFIKIQPQSVDFLDITDPRAVLEHSLRNFATLTRGDLIAIKYNNKIYELLVMESRPDEGICVLETDLQVDFAAPIGYAEPSQSELLKPKKSIASSLEKSSIPATSQVSSSVPSSFTPFSGSANKLSNRPKAFTSHSEAALVSAANAPTDAMSAASLSGSASSAPSVAPLKLPPGTLVFGALPKRSPTNTSDSTTATVSESNAPSTSAFKAFMGQGRRLQ